MPRPRAGLANFARQRRPCGTEARSVDLAIPPPDLWRTRDRSRSRMDLGDLAMRPPGRVLGLHALDRLGVHVGDDVFRHHLGGPPAGWSGVAREPAERGYVAESPQHGIDVPHLVLLPLLRGAVAVALLRGEPLVVDRPRVNPTQEVFCPFRVPRIAH